MNLKLWQKRERFAEIVFTIVLALAVGFTFIYDYMNVEKGIFFVIMGLLEAALLVLVFSRSMNIYEMYKNKEKINVFKIVSLILYIIMFGILGYYFLLLR